MKAETTIRRISFGAISLGFLLTGVFWLQIKPLWPALTQQVNIVAMSPVSWFVVIMFFLAVLAFHKPRVNSDRTSIEKISEGVPPKAVIQKPSERIYTQITAPNLLKLFEGRTSIQANILVENHLNKWMNVTGLVKEVQRFAKCTSVYLKEGDAFVAAEFEGEWADRVIHLTQESQISIMGRLEGATMGVVRLAQCEIV